MKKNILLLVLFMLFYGCGSSENNTPVKTKNDIESNGVTIPKGENKIDISANSGNEKNTTIDGITVSSGDDSIDIGSSNNDSNLDGIIFEK